MLIDKVSPFYTNLDRLTLAQIDMEIDKLLEEGKDLTAEMQAAKEAGNTEALKQLAGRSYSLWAEHYAKLDERKTEIMRAAEQRYIESFAGNIEAILADIHEILSATNKTEYIRVQQRRNEVLKPVLENKPGKDSPKEDKISYRKAKALSVRGFHNCFVFLLTRVRVQLNAVEYYNSEEGKTEALLLVEDKATSFYSKPKNTKIEWQPTQEREPVSSLISIDTKGGLFTHPTGPILNLVYDIMISGEVDSLPDRKMKYNRNIRLKVEENGPRRKLSYTKGNDTVTVEITDIRKLSDRNPQAPKILTRILMKAAEQALYSGTLYRDYISFPLLDLVGEGQYKNIETARQGFYNATDILVGDIKVSGKIERGKKKILQQGKLEVLFTGAEVDTGECKVYLNPRLSWAVIAPYFTGLPDWYYMLPNRAAVLLEYIFYLARMNTQEIAEQGFFTISYRAIQDRLNLPNETLPNGKPINNPRRDIKDQIEMAVSQIEDMYAKCSPPLSKDVPPDLALELIEDYNAPIKKYLDEGRLKVFLNGEYARRFIDLHQQTKLKIEEAQKRQERIEDQAKAINLAKSMESNK